MFSSFFRLLLLYLFGTPLVFGALVSNPNDPRQWQGASVGTFAQLFYGLDNPTNRQRVVDEQLLDDGFLTADLSQSGTLVPTFWARNYRGCAGASNNVGYGYTCSAGRTAFELANFIDELWLQTSGQVGDSVWDLGAVATQAAIFVGVDHGPLPGEAIESTIYVSNSQTGPWSQAEVIRVYLQGYLADSADGSRNIYDGFTYVVRHPTVDTFRYISLTHGGPGALRIDGDDEINGVVGLDLNFNPVRLPFEACVNILLSSASVTTQQINPILLTGKWTNNAVSNYGYSIYERSSGQRIRPSPRSNTLQVFFTQDWENKFSLNFLVDSNDGSGGSLNLRVRSSNLGSPSILVYDDPTSGTASLSDPNDQYQWFPSSGEGNFQWSWGPTTTDGVVLGPIEIVNINVGFNVELEIVSSSGLSTFSVMSEVSGAITSIDVPLNEKLFIRRESCSCGDSNIDQLEECDGGPCCDNKCKITVGNLCRGIQGPCDLEEYCDGSSGNCPTDRFLPSGSLVCRPSQGVCDVAESCSGSSAQCPNDLKSSAECRSKSGQCDVADFCDGVSNDCPVNGFEQNGTPCDDGNGCSSSSECQDGACEPVSYDVCSPTCGNGVTDNTPPFTEQCDGEMCCTECLFTPSSSVCRNSTGRCDPAEYCTGSSIGCPVDDNTSCPICTNDCNGNGICVPLTDNFRVGDPGKCECNVGWLGLDCSIPDCKVFDECSSCSSHPECGWCCSSGKCFEGNATSPHSLECGAWQFDDCGCNPGCSTGGNCVCGKCECSIGRTGETCDLYIGCDGKSYQLEELPETDICGVCNGTNSTCLGCDGVPYSGVENDNCGVCGGDGSSCSTLCSFKSCDDCVAHGAGNCHWCDSDKTCYEIRHNFNCKDDRWIEKSCDDFLFGNLTPEQAAGLGAGIIAVIVIASVAAVILLGVGGKKGYDYWKGKDNRMGQVQENPLYENNQLGGDNPLYSEESHIQMKQV